MHGTEKQGATQTEIFSKTEKWKEKFFTEHIFNNLKYISHNLKLSQNWHAENPM